MLRDRARKLAQQRISGEASFPSSSLPSSDCNEIERIHGQRSVTSTPVQMRSGHSPSRSDETNLLSASNRVTLRNQRATQMKVAGHNAGTVVDVNNIPGEKEIRDECDNT